MKQYFVKFMFAIVALIFAGAALSACASTANSTNTTEKAAAGTAQNAAAENVQTNVTESPKPTQIPKTNGLPEFKKGEDYKSSVRGKMLKDGWKPAPTEDADKCGSGDSKCDEFPELESCAGTGLGNCKFLWRKADKTVAIFTIGDPQVYDGQAFEKETKTTASTGDQKWESFWTQFKSAMDSRNTQNLRRLMADDFFDGGGGGTADEWLASIQKNNSWSFNQKSVAEGTIPGKCEVPCRTTKDGYLVFENRNGKWLWAALGGEGVEN